MSANRDWLKHPTTAERYTAFRSGIVIKKTSIPGFEKVDAPPPPPPKRTQKRKTD